MSSGLKMGSELIGQSLGKYRIVRAIGSGGMGTVYEGRHETLEQKVAVKVLAPEMSGNADAVRRFFQEGRFVAKLRHDNIVAVYDLGEERGTHYLAMEYVEGRPLTELIEAKGTLKPHNALHIARQVSDALAAAHAQSVVHRDIKPDNIMVNTEAKVKVMDFGVAKGMGQDAGLTTAGAAIGTLLYMSPEQCRGVEVDQRSDLFSLGVVLFQMVTGRLPYSETLAHLDLMNKIAQGPLPSPRYVNSEVTEAVEQIILKLTATNPDERYQSALDVSDDLRHCIRIKAYRAEGGSDSGGEKVKRSLRRLLSPGSAPKGANERKRSSVARRREDRERIAEVTTIKGQLERLSDEKRQTRHAVRRNCTALFYENCASIKDTEARGEPLRARLLDLSESGAALFLEQKFSDGSRLVVEFRWEEGTSVRTPAEVCWTRPIEKQGGFATGLRFVETPEQEKKRLARVLEEIRQNVGL